MAKPVLISIAAVVLLGGGFWVLLKDSTTLSFNVLLDGKPLPLGVVPKVELDGRAFTSGLTVTPGPHSLTVDLPAAEPFEQRVWVFFGKKSMGALPLVRSTGTLMLTTEPAGLDFTLQGETWHTSKTPANLTGLPAGPYELTFRRKGWPEQHRSVLVERNDVVRVTGDFVGGTLNLDTEPVGLSYEVEVAHDRGIETGFTFSKIAGETPANLTELPVGNYFVTFRREGWPEQRSRVTVERSGVGRVTGDFIGGTLNLTTEPSGLDYEVIPVVGNTASLTKMIGKTPANLTDLPVGNYRVALRRTGWPAQASNVEIKRNEIASVTAETGTVVVTSTPAGLEVWAGGKKVGMTPFSLTDTVPGRYDFELKVKSRSLQSVSGTVVARQELRLNASLGGVLPIEGQAWNILGLNLEMVSISPGTFRMGSSNFDDAVAGLYRISPGTSQMGGASDETSEGRPATQVTLTKPYWLGAKEVTQAQWQAVMGNNPSDFKADDRPVERVTWDDAREFCRKLTEQERASERLPEDYVYTLPTEAQWEYACRAGTSGDHAGALDTIAWYAENADASHPVGTKQPNEWGLYDMHGNVKEWCLDRYGRYPGGSVADPTGVTIGLRRVYRGGAWLSSAANCRSAYRSYADENSRERSLGFRVALTYQETSQKAAVTERERETKPINLEGDVNGKPRAVAARPRNERQRLIAAGEERQTEAAAKDNDWAKPFVPAERAAQGNPNHARALRLQEEADAIEAKLLPRAT